MSMAPPPDPVLVTGASGFIGRRLVRALGRAGGPVFALVLPDEYPDPDWPDSVQVIKGDVTRIESLRRVLPSQARIIHLAAMVGDWGEVREHWHVTVEGTENLLAVACEKAARRLVLASSIVVYGHHIGGDQPLLEDHPLGTPLGAYDRCKQEQEALWKRFSEEAGIPYAIVRPANVYGPGSGPWVLTLLEEMKRGTPTLIGGGDYDAGLVYVDNLVQLLILATTRPEAEGQIYNGVDGLDVTWRQYMTDLSRLAQVPRPKSFPGWAARRIAPGMAWAWHFVGAERRPPLTPLAYRLVGQHNRFSNAKAREDLGWEPQVGYDAALSAIADSLVS